MKRIGIIIVLLYLQVVTIWGQDTSVAMRWEEAGRAYTAQQYRHAAMLYEQMAKEAAATDAVYYNLGNAYCKDGDTGKAVLNYKRALRFNPGNTKARENITFLHSRISGVPVVLPEVFFVRWYHALARMVSVNAWAILALVAFLGMLSVVYLIRSRQLRFGYRWLSFTLVLLFGCMSLAYTGYRNLHRQDEAVVLSGQAFLYKTAAMDTVKSSIPEGTVVRLLGSTKGTKVRVRMSDGSEGWIDLADIEIV